MPVQEGPRHSYKRDSRMPDWHGWHAPGRGLGSQSLSVNSQSKFHLERCRGGAWTTPNERPSPEGSRALRAFQNDLKKKVAICGREHRTLQADRPEDSVAEIRQGLKFIPPERLGIRTWDFLLQIFGK